MSSCSRSEKQESKRRFPSRAQESKGDEGRRGFGGEDGPRQWG